jgi:hypothetical protein
MKVRRRNGGIWELFAFLIPVPVAALCAWRTWMRPSQPNANDFAGRVDQFARVVMTTWTTLVALCVVFSIVVWIDSEIDQPKKN